VCPSPLFLKEARLVSPPSQFPPRACQRMISSSSSQLSRGTRGRRPFSSLQFVPEMVLRGIAHCASVSSDASICVSLLTFFCFFLACFFFPPSLCHLPTPPFRQAFFLFIFEISSKISVLNISTRRKVPVREGARLYLRFRRFFFVPGSFEGFAVCVSGPFFLGCMRCPAFEL